MALIEKGDPNFLQQYRPMMDEIINKYIEVHSKEERSYEVGGLYYFYTHRFDEAKKFFYGYVEEYPEDQSASVALVECLMYLECWEELSQEGRKAYARFPEEYTFLELAAIGDYHLGNYDKVLEVCSELLSLVDDEAKAAGILATAGDAYYNLNDKKNAYKAYDAVLKMDPDNLYVLNNYAYYLCLDGRNLKKAYEMSRKTIEAEPDNVTYMDTFGWILYLQGKYIEARPIFKNAMLHGGKESAVILDHYAEVLYALGEYDMAFIYWNLAMQKDTADVPGLREKVDARRQEVKK